jgi:hypothetical protein
MALIVGSALAQVKSQLDQVLPARQIEQACQQLGHRWRKRLLDPPVTLYLLLLQLLSNVGLSGLRHVSKLNVSAQALCRARMRLPLAVLMQLVEYSAAGTITGEGKGECSAAGQGAASRWRGHAVALADGTGFQTPDTPELAGRYGRAANHTGVSRGFPAPKLLAAVDLTTGLIRRVIALPWSRQERTCLTRLLAALAGGTILLADRGFSGFAQLAMMRAAGIHGLLRLPCQVVVGGKRRWRRRRQIGRLGKQDLLVSWTRDGLVRPRWMSRVRWGALPPELTLRQIAFRITRPGHRVRWAWIITTLNDPKAYPAADLVDLYARRWQVEVYFRDLKQGLGLGRLSARTVAGVRKELLAWVLLYNLVRRAMLQAARQQHVAADRISFTDAVSWLLWSSPGDPLPRLCLNPRRRRSSHPRMLKNARKRYTQLNRPRERLTKPPCTAKL